MFSRLDFKHCCKLLKEKYFAGLIDDESILILSPNAKEYCACIFDKDNESELYLYRLLTREEYNEINSLRLAESWSVEANDKHTGFALIYEKCYSHSPTIKEISKDLVQAMDYLVKEVET